MVVALLAGLVAVGIGSEFYLRNRVSNCLAQSVEQSVGSDVDVTISSRPMLLQWMDGKTPYVEVTSAEPRFGGAEGMDLQLRLNDVQSSTDSAAGTTISGSTATVNWSAEGIAQTLRSQGIGMIVSGVTANPDDQTLEIAILGSLAGITAKPMVVGDTIKIEVTEATLFGMGIPTELPQQIVDILTKGLTQYPLELKPEALTVTDTGIEVNLVGGPTSLSASEAQVQAASSAQPVACELF